MVKAHMRDLREEECGGFVDQRRSRRREPSQNGTGMPRMAALRCAGSRRLLPWKQALLTIHRIEVPRPYRTIMVTFPWIRDIPSNVATAGLDGPAHDQRGRLGPPLPRKELMARTNPTLRQRRLGVELRRMREQAGFGGSQLGRAVGMNPAQVTQMESGKIGISVERLRTIAATCMCANQPLIDALADIITDRGKPGWWEEYRETLAADFLEVAELEHFARALSTYTITFVPGLLQTSSYASAVFSQAYPPLPRHEVDLRTAFRIQRQRVVHSGTTPYSAFIHEAALRMQFSGTQVRADQLDALIEDSEAPGISVRVLPFDITGLPSPIENFTYATGTISDLDTVQTDTGFGSQLLDAPAHVARFRAILAQMDSTALPAKESREFLRSMKKEMEE
ncbi:helix-turn-helix domain-containing protein [Kitasatospora sp. NPDC091207]|uniref:helix-turn-helix domain-containing protein n=1 Tax=Kitasatospora sp. NPDC091207 TaxID=3364083 RepID=UPI0037F6B871